MTTGHDRLDALHAARSQFWWTVGAGAGLPLIIHLTSPVGHSPLIRLVLTAIFFLALATLTWALTEPLKAYLSASWRLRVEDAGPSIEAAAQGLVLEMSRLTTTLGWLLTGLVGVTGLRVLSAWPQFSALDAVSGFLALAWWGSAAAVALFLLTSSGRVRDILAQKRALERQMHARGFSERDEIEVAERIKALDGNPVEVTGPLAFRVGGLDWHWNDLMANAIVFGQSGSGKTLTVLNAMLDGLLSSASSPWVTLPASGLILDAKGDFRDKITGLMHGLCRDRDLLILDPLQPERSIRWNPFDSTDDELELAERIAAVMAMVGQKAGDTTFFLDNAKRVMRHAIALLRATSPDGEPPSFAGINEVVSSPGRLEARIFLAQGLLLTRLLYQAGPDRLSRILALAGRDDALRAALAELGEDQATASLRLFLENFYHRPDAEKDSVHRRLQHLIDRLAPAGSAVAFRENIDVTQAVAYFTDEWLMLSDSTRTSIQASLTPMVDQFEMEPYRTVLSGRSTTSIADAVRDGRLLYVHMPAAEKDSMAPVINTLVKLEFQRQVLRQVRTKQRPSLFLCDEFQSVFTAEGGRGDAAFFERSRESGHVNLVATQNMNALLLKAQRPEAVYNLLGNCAVKIFLRNGDLETNEYASRIFGQSQMLVPTFSRSVPPSGGATGLGIAEQLQSAARLPPDAFTTLRIPVRGEARPHSEAWVLMGNRRDVKAAKLRFGVHPL